jgi:hypothetical protein
MKIEPKLVLSCPKLEHLLEPLFVSYDHRNIHFLPCLSITLCN